MARITPEVAAGLLTAIAMDTGWFRHSNTRAGTLRAVAELIDAGAQVDDIYRKLFETKHAGPAEADGRDALGDANRPGGKNRLRHDFAATTCCAPVRSRRIRKTWSITRSACGASRLACCSSSKPRGGVKVSFRARNGLDCSRLAAQFGGGGHREAAGATVPGRCPRSSNGCSRRCERRLGSRPSAGLNPSNVRLASRPAVDSGELDVEFRRSTDYSNLEPNRVPRERLPAA